jgi:hypothetical protein
MVLAEQIAAVCLGDECGYGQEVLLAIKLHTRLAALQNSILADNIAERQKEV